ncbi:hypothetical protein Fmac_002066 [Flemingia macrophylla]|uniref:Uncharacterized protein n=1 Tax=Flemingia macrophylla TaxID=520843 RepID=A0ABD1NJ14_9FABA
MESSNSMRRTLEISVVSAEGLSCLKRIDMSLTKLHSRSRYDGTGEHVFRVPLDPSFSDSLVLQLFNKRRFLGPTHLGSCLIPPSDIALPPYHSLRHLSYRLRARDGSSTHIIVNLSIRFHASPDLHTCQPVLGIPITALRKFSISNADASQF